MRWFLLLSFFIFFKEANAQYPFTAGSKAAAMGHNGLLLEDVWAVHNSAAALANVTHFQAGIWVEKRFMLKDLSCGAAAFSVPLKKGNKGVFGAGYYYFGHLQYLQQQKFNLVYGLKLSPTFNIGASLNFLKWQQPQPYNSRILVIGDVAFQYTFHPNWRAGARIWNPTGSNLSKVENERLPAVFNLALAHKISNGLWLLANALHQQKKETQIGFGIHYKVAESIVIQAGVKTNPGQFSLGAGFRVHKIDLHLAFAFHPQLNVTPHSSFVYAAQNQDALP